MPHYEVVFPKGIGFRHSPCLADKSKLRPVKGGEVLEGETVAGEGGYWMALSTGEGLFLPLRAPDGTELVRQLPDSASGGGGLPGSAGKFVEWNGGDNDGGFGGGRGAAANGSYAGGAGAFGGSRPSSRGAIGGGGPPGRTDELAAMDAKYDKTQKFSRRSAPGGGVPAAPLARRPPPTGPAANSHDRANDYMNEFRGALEGMGVDTKDDPFLDRYAPIGGAKDEVRPAPGARRPSGGVGSRPGSGARAASNGAPRIADRTRPGTGSTAGARPGSTSSSRGSRSPAVGEGGGSLAMCGALIGRSNDSGTQGRWNEGPKNAIVAVKEWTSVKHGEEKRSKCTSGRIIDVSDRNVLCMSMFDNKAVLGSADHGLQEVNIERGTKLRNLYTKRYGHAEWVTSVAHCPDGRIVSGGQDSKLCLWNAAGVVCADMTGHMGPISRVRVDPTGKLAISSSYDRTLGVFDLRAKRLAATCTGHNAPVMDFVWLDSTVASGDRRGEVKTWDTNHGTNTGTLKGHKGHITSMLAFPDDGVSTIATGAQDGCIRVWDLRQKLNVCTMNCHAGGSVNDLGITLNKSPPLMVSTGADGRVLVLEPRSGFKILHEFAGVTEDFLYSLLVLDNVAFVGDGRGQVTCFDLQDGKNKYSLNAGENAIRCIGATASHLVCSGDDGNVIVFDF